MGGKLGLSFSVAPDTTRYIGRLLLEVPRRVTMGVPFTFTVQDTRDATLAVSTRNTPTLGNRPWMLRCRPDKRGSRTPFLLQACGMHECQTRQ